MNSPLLARGGVLIKLDRERVVFYSNESTWQLLKKHGRNFLSALFSSIPQSEEDEAAGVPPEVEIKSMAVLESFLHIGLQVEAAEHGEHLTLQQVQDFITPYTYPKVFNAVIEALGRDVQAAPQPGNQHAATASPAPAANHPGPTKASTLTTRSAPPSRSAGRGKPSGRQRHGS